MFTTHSRVMFTRHSRPYVYQWKCVAGGLKSRGEIPGEGRVVWSERAYARSLHTTRGKLQTGSMSFKN